MNICTNNLDEYILCALGICGEIERDWLYDNVNNNKCVDENSQFPHAHGSHEYVRKRLKALEKKGYIKHTLEDQKTYRLKKDGLEFLKNNFPEIYINYMKLTNNHTFSGSQSFIRRQKHRKELLQYLLSNGDEINGINLIRKSNHFGKQNLCNPEENDSYAESVYNENGEPKLFGELLSIFSPHKTHFLGSKITRQSQAVKIRYTSRTLSSRMYGVIIKNDNLYPVYYLPQNKVTWIRDVEKSANLNFQNLWRKKIGDEKWNQKRIGNPDGEALFFMKSYESIFSFYESLKSEDNKSLKPWDVFSSTYFISMDRAGERVKKIVLSDNWEEKLLDCLFTKEQQKGRYGKIDAKNNGVSLIQILTWDLCKLNYIETSLYEGNPIAVICHPVQEKFLKQIGVRETITADENLIDKIIEKISS